MGSQFVQLAAMAVLGMSFFLSAQAADRWTILHEKDPAAADVTLDWVVRSGSLADGVDQAGLAHFTARAMLRGTTTRPYADLTRTLQSLGATIEVETTREFTAFHTRFPSSRFLPILYVLRDVFTRPAFDPLEVENLRGELLAETQAALRDPLEVGRRAALKDYYAGTSAQHPPTGTVESLSRISALDLRSFFRKYYGSANSVISVVSPWDEAWVNAKLNYELAPVATLALDGRTVPASSLAGMTGVVVASLQPSDYLPFHWILSGVAASDPDRPALEIANQALGVGSDSRLAQLDSTQAGWFASVGSGFDLLMAPMLGQGVFSIAGTSKRPFVTLGIPATVQLLRDYLRHGMADADLQRAKFQLNAYLPGFYSSPQSRLKRKLEAHLQGRPDLDESGWAAEWAKWDVQTVSSRMGARLSDSPSILIAVGDPALLMPVLQAIPGMGTVRTVR